MAPSASLGYSTPCGCTVVLCGTPFLNVRRMVSPTVARMMGPSRPRYASSGARSWCARRG